MYLRAPSCTFMRGDSFDLSLSVKIQVWRKPSPKCFVACNHRFPLTICQQGLKLRALAAEGFITISPLMGNYTHINKRN